MSECECDERWEDDDDGDGEKGSVKVDALMLKSNDGSSVQSSEGTKAPAGGGGTGDMAMGSDGQCVELLVMDRRWCLCRCQCAVGRYRGWI